jgi:hypothetical protein
MPRRAGRTRRGGAFLAATLGVLVVTSCGSRTGLFVDASVAGGGGRGGSRDAALDAPTDAPPDAVPCVPGRFDFTLARAQIMFVIDRSGSMDFSLTSEEPPAAGEPTRWEALRSALETAVAPLDAELEVGAKFYPESVADTNVAREGCYLDSSFAIAPAPKNLGALLNVFDTRSPYGGTPTSEATRMAADVLKARRGAVRTLVIATDGAPNCNMDLNPRSCVCTIPGACGQQGDAEQCLDDVRTVQTIADVATSDKIPVYVIGIGAATQPVYRKTLDDMAVAGGRPRNASPKYYPAQSQAELGTALADIRDSVAHCTYLTPSAPTDPDAIAVEIGGVPVAHDPTRQDGWEWIDKDYGELALFGTACDEATADGGNVTVSGVVRCE